MKRMNVAKPVVTADRESAEQALKVLQAWAKTASGAEIASLNPAIARLVPGAAGQGRGDNSYPDLSRSYDADFKVDEAYRAGLPDLQNGPASLIVGAKTRIEHVGISNFRLPLRYRMADGSEMMLETSVTGSVSLEAEKKGINMSRIIRSFYTHADDLFAGDVMAAVIDEYKTRLDSFDARLSLGVSLPVKRRSLRSGLSGWQYYDVVAEQIDRDGQRARVMHLDYVYASTCPCSLELSEHARRERGQLATPHSQRSVARISVLVANGAAPEFTDLIDMARRAIPTETQVMVKREDEQAFAELNAAHPIFVEDAARALAGVLMADARIADFRVVASHQESLHSHDAVAILTEGPYFDSASVEPHLFRSLIHTR